jgi:hypothetical protein
MVLSTFDINELINYGNLGLSDEAMAIINRLQDDMADLIESNAAMEETISKMEIDMENIKEICLIARENTAVESISKIYEIADK